MNENEVTDWIKGRIEENKGKKRIGLKWNEKKCKKGEEKEEKKVPDYKSTGSEAWDFEWLIPSR